MRLDPRKETGMAVLAAILIMAVLGLMMLSSCTTKEKTVTEYVAVHDTIHSHHTDTLREVSFQVRVDTVRQRETHTITLNNVGDTIREIHHFHDSEKVIVVDSTQRYEARMDSLEKALEREKSKEVTKQKVPLSAIAKWLVISALVFGILRACLGIFIVVLRSKTNS